MMSSNNWRIQAAVINLKNSKLLIINSYFPADRRNLDNNIEELIETLECIKQVIETAAVNQLLLFGDVNADFIRNSPHCLEIKRFLHKLNMEHAWDHYEVDFTHCQQNNDDVYLSTLDHFFWNSNLSNKVIIAGVLHLPDNLSDHSPIFCVLKDEVEVTPEQTPNCRQPRPIWEVATEMEKISFKDELNSILTSIEVPASLISCEDVHCLDPAHHYAADTYMIAILDALETAANVSLPSSSNRKHKKKCRPGWTDNVAPFRDTAVFWSEVWKSAGKPLIGQLFNIMKRSKNVYHYQIRKLKKSENLIKKNNLLDACLGGNSDLFKEIKKLRRHENTIATDVDGVKDNISEHFKDI